jgi:hypothetical protein
VASLLFAATIGFQRTGKSVLEFPEKTWLLARRSESARTARFRRCTANRRAGRARPRPDDHHHLASLGSSKYQTGRSRRRRARPQTTLSLSPARSKRANSLTRGPHTPLTRSHSLASSLRSLPSSSSGSRGVVNGHARTPGIWSPYGLPQQRRRPASWQPARRAPPALPLLRRCTHR